MLLTLDEIKEGLDKEFLPIEPTLTGFRLLPQAGAGWPLGHWSREPNTMFADGLLEIASRFDLGRLTIGPVTFGSRGNYVHDLDVYNEYQSAGGLTEFLIFAISDPFSYAVARKDGAVYVLDPEKGLPEGPIAGSVAKFLMGVGTVFLKRRQVADKVALADEVANAVNSSYGRFWHWLSS
jgi:hypothetical protein